MCYARLAGGSCRSIAVGYPSSGCSPTGQVRCCSTSRSQAQVHAACTCRTPKEMSLMGLVGGSTRSSPGTAKETCRYYAACRLRQRFAHPNRLRRDRAGTMPDRTPGRSKGKEGGSVRHSGQTKQRGPLTCSIPAILSPPGMIDALTFWFPYSCKPADSSDKRP